MANGRPTKFKPEYIEQAKKISWLGATDAQLADIFEVNVDTIYEWKKVHKKFSEALKSGKAIADAKVVESLYSRAVGYSHPEDKIFNDSGEPLIVPTIKHYPPDATSCIYWLNNRQGHNWRNKSDVGIEGDIIVNLKKFSDGE